MRALIINYATRRISVGSCQDLPIIHKQLETGIPWHIETDYFETLVPFDIVTFSNVAGLPGIIKLFLNGSMAYKTIGLTYLLGFIASVAYHSHHEQKYQKVDALIAKANVAVLLVAFQWSYSSIVKVTIAFFFYLLAMGRERSVLRYRYTLFHTLFHCMMGLAFYEVVSDTLQ